MWVKIISSVLSLDIHLSTGDALLGGAIIANDGNKVKKEPDEIVLKDKDLSKHYHDKYILWKDQFIVKRRYDVS